MICAYCKGDFPKLIKAHIIPRSFFKIIRGSSKYSVVVNASEKGVKKEYKQAGIFDDEILCQKCEQLFGPYDNYGYKAFTEVLAKRQIYVDDQGNPCALLFQNLDYGLLKLFVLSMLWRASVSRHTFFSKVRLGPYEEVIRQMIHNRELGNPDEFSFICLHSIAQKYPHLIIPPWLTKMSTVSYYRFYLPDITVLIKVDKRPFPSEFQTLAIRPSPPHYLAFMPHQDSSEERYIEGAAQIMREHHKRNEDNSKH